MLEWQTRLYLGTWQLSGSFGPWTSEARVHFIREAWGLGIRRFDTAPVYGAGRVEEALGATLPESAVILTKLPAIRKPDRDLFETPEALYPTHWIEQQLTGCQQRLRRPKIDIVLLHNWLSHWTNKESLSPLMTLQRYRDGGLIGKIGISLPNGFGGLPSADTLDLIDVVEVPVNSQETWILPGLELLRNRGIEVIVRSIFQQGMVLKSPLQCSQLDPADIRRRTYVAGLFDEQLVPTEILTQVWKRNTSVVIGMTTTEQLKENIAIVQRKE
jgi:aryl-alcohol dehydrogenase-like predicted oxidoreductase